MICNFNLVVRDFLAKEFTASDLRIVYHEVFTASQAAAPLPRGGVDKPFVVGSRQTP